MTAKKSVLTIGNFDGVHRGHRALLKTICDWKRAQSDSDNFKTVVITFDPHPIEVLHPERFVHRLCTLEERISLLQNAGADDVRVLHFTKEFAAMSARDFFDKVLLKDLNAAFVAVGHDFTFGRGREGTPGKIIDWCAEKGIPAHLVDAIESDGEIISSSRIRKLVGEGQMIHASRLLGRDYSFTGPVLHGDKRGRLLGFPTANLIPQTEGIGARCLPAKGVYLSTSTFEGKTYSSVTNVGVKPTVSASGQLVVETHLLDFTGDLYGKQLTVEFKDRLRDEKRFAGLDELKQQIQEDTLLARARLQRI